MGKYSGAILRTKTQNDQPSMAFHPDPLHGQNVPDQTVPDSHMTDPQQGVEYMGTDFDAEQAQGYGSFLANPVVTHDGLAGPRIVKSDDEHREQIETLHADDGQRGWVRSSYHQPPYQSYDTEYEDELRQDETIYAHANNTGAVSVMAGIDGNPQNNPEGIREGLVRRWWMERNARDLSPRSYTRVARPLWDHRPHIQEDQPPQSDNPLTQSPVLPLLTPEGVYRRLKFAAMFRMPPAAEDSLLAQEQPSEPSVIGGGF